MISLVLKKIMERQNMKIRICHSGKRFWHVISSRGCIMHFAFMLQTPMDDSAHDVVLAHNQHFQIIFHNSDLYGSRTVMFYCYFTEQY